MTAVGVLKVGVACWLTVATLLYVYFWFSREIDDGEYGVAALGVLMAGFVFACVLLALAGLWAWAL